MITSCLDFMIKIKDLRPELYADLHMSKVSQSSAIFRKHGFDVNGTDNISKSVNMVYDEIVKTELHKSAVQTMKSIQNDMTANSISGYMNKEIENATRTKTETKT